MSTALDAILSDYASDLEVTCEIDSAKRDDGTAKTWYFSTHIRSTGASDTPANTTFLPFLMNGSIGPLSQSLSEDEMFSGLAANSPGSITLLQVGITPDELSPMNDYVFAGYEVRIKIGREGEDYDNFVTFRTTTVSIDPSVQTTGGGIEATFPLSGALTRTLEENLTVKRYLGIPHCYKSLTVGGNYSIPSNSAYSVKSFTLMLRFRGASASFGTTGFAALSRRQNSSTDRQFQIALYHGSHATLAGKVQVDVSCGGVAKAILAPASSPNYLDGEWHSLILSIQDKTTAYVMVDKVVLGTVGVSVLTASVDTPAAAIASVTMAGGSVCDLRFYDRYMTPDEARGEAEVRSEGDSLNCVGLWRFDDNTGGTANDYSATANDATLSGVENTDYQWTYTDLGEPELAGKPYPLVAGNVLNAQAQLIDVPRKRYRGNADSIGWHSSGSNTTIAVKSRGTLLTGGGVDYTTPSDGGGGVFSTTAQEDEPVTYDLLNNGTNESATYPGELASWFLNNRSDLLFDTPSVNSLSILTPWPSGYWIDQETTAQTVLSDLLGQSGIHYYENLQGLIRLSALLPPAGYGPYGEPVADFRGDVRGGVTAGNIGSISGSCTLAGWFKVFVADQTAYDFATAEPNRGTLYFAQKGTNYNAYFQAVGSGAGKLAFQIAGTTLKTSAGLVEPYTWYFFGCVFDDTANTQKFYLAEEGGSLLEVASTTNSSSPTTNAAEFRVGGLSGAYSWHSAQHIQVWSVAKTLAELQTLMSTPPVGNEANLLVYFPLNEGTGNPIEVVNSIDSGGFLSQDRAGWAPKFLVDLDSTPSVTLSSFHHIHPAGEIIVNYAKNRTPMTSADIDTGVSQNDRITLTRTGLDVRFDSPDIRDRFPSAKRIILDSPILDQESAQRLLQMTQRRFGEDVYTGVLDFPPGLNISRLACGLEIGDEIGLTGTIPSQLQTPRSFRVVAVAPNPLTLSTSVVIFG